MKNSLFAVGFIVPLLMGVSVAGAAQTTSLITDFNTPSYLHKVEASDFCTVEKCRNLSSVRAFNKKHCKSQEECLSWLKQNKICDAAALQRCSEREQLGAEKVPNVRTDGMDF